MIAVKQKEQARSQAQMAEAIRQVKAALRDGRPVQEHQAEVEALSQRLQALKEKGGATGGVQLSPYMMWALVRCRRGQAWGG